MCSRWLWNVWYSGCCSTLKIRECFNLLLANQCNRSKSFDNLMHSNHPTIFFNQNCSWYKTLILLPHLLNMSYKFSATIAWRPHDLSPHNCWTLQELWLTFAGESPFSISSVASFAAASQLSTLGTPDTVLGCLAQQAGFVLILLFPRWHSAKNVANLRSN